VTLPAPPRRKRSPLALLFLVVFVDILGFGLVIPLLARYARELGAHDAVIGLLSTGFSGMQLVFAPMWGRLSDRIGRRPVLLVSIAMTSVAYLASALAPNFWFLLAARLFAGIATANFAIAQAFVADVTRPEDRARGMGVLGAAFGLGFVVGPAAGGLLATISLGAPFIAAGALAAVNLVAAWLILPEPPRPAVRPIRRSRWRDLRLAMARPGVGRLLAIYFLSMFAFSAMESTFALLTADRWQLSDRGVGLVFGYIGILIALVQGGLIGPLSRRIGERTMLVAGMALMALSLALLPFAPGLGGLLAACAPLAIGNGLAQPALSALLSRLSPAEEQGGALGVGQSAAALGRVVGPETGTLTYHAGLAYPYLGGAVMMAVASVLGAAARLPPAVRPGAERPAAAGDGLRSPSAEEEVGRQNA
jgi:predicted MFS family arabinose efflux permease